MNFLQCFNPFSRCTFNLITNVLPCVIDGDLHILESGFFLLLTHNIFGPHSCLEAKIVATLLAVSPRPHGQSTPQAVIVVFAREIRRSRLLNGASEEGATTVTRLRAVVEVRLVAHLAADRTRDQVVVVAV